MNIYTKTGDDGTTGLIGGQRISKSARSIECFGTVDELNAAIGLACVIADGDLLAMLRLIQNELFVVGSHLALPTGKDVPTSQWIPPLSETPIGRLEKQIDAAEATLPPLKNFILPGGNELAARLHLARTICRRAERMTANLSTAQPVPQIVVTYLNRLSDWLFVHARLANHQKSVTDILWHK